MGTMLGRFLLACGVYVLMAAVLGLCILRMMNTDLGIVSRLWPLALASAAFMVAFVRIGCREEGGH